MRRIYLDHNATTRPHPDVRAAMVAWLEGQLGNPSSLHAEGRAAREAVEVARREVAALVGAAVDEVVFTSGGTEADNLAVLGGARAARRRDGRRRVVVSSRLEHPAVRAALGVLAAEGFAIRDVPVDGDGRLDLDGLAALVDGETALVTLALANHELGNVYPIARVAEVAHAAGALVHTDAVQAVGRLPVDVRALGADLISISAHKLYGPQGAGALVERRGCDVVPLVVGGHQERERRAGTENVAALVGFGVACGLARRRLVEWGPDIGRLRDRLEAGALASVAGARRFGAEPRVPGTTNLGFAGAEGELVMASLDLEGIAVSTGAACSSGSLEPSPVVLALGVGPELARTATRFSLGRENVDEDVDRVLALLPGIVERIRRAGDLDSV